MDFFKYIEKTPIPQGCGCSYDAMAYDGCNYYFLIPCECEIIRTDKQYGNIACCEVSRVYNCICFDCDENCFWAASQNANRKIFKLDCNMQEIDYITVGGCKEADGIITGLSYNCCDKAIYVAYAGCVLSVSKKCEDVTINYRTNTLWITGICCVCPYYIVYAIKGCKQYVILFNAQNQPLCTELVPCNYLIKGVVFNPCVENACCCKRIAFDVLANKRGCYPYVIKVENVPCTLDLRPRPCNYTICDKCCSHSHCTSKDACADIIESIALVETALSHVINAEGEKLQKVLATTDDIDKIMCVNREINKTIINATHLEHTLYAKLSAATECCECDQPCN